MKYLERSLKIWDAHSEAQATALCNLGQAYQAMGESRRAEAALRQALEILPRAGQVWLALGQVLFLRRDYRGAEAAQLQALVLFEESKSLQAVALNDLAVLYQAKHNDAKAAESLERAVALLGPGQARARMLCNLGVLRWKAGRKAEAESGFKQALREMEEAVGSQHPDVGRILEEYSVVLKKSGRVVESRDMQTRAKGIQSTFAAQTNSGRITVDWRDLK